MANRTAIVVESWNDHPFAKQAQFDCMLMLSPGVWYHNRLDIVFVITKDLRPVDLKPFG
jgi:predicted alpha/beta superfamily hydrolase